MRPMMLKTHGSKFLGNEVGYKFCDGAAFLWMVRVKDFTRENIYFRKFIMAALIAEVIYPSLFEQVEEKAHEKHSKPLQSSNCISQFF